MRNDFSHAEIGSKFELTILQKYIQLLYHSLAQLL